MYELVSQKFIIEDLNMSYSLVFTLININTISKNSLWFFRCKVEINLRRQNSYSQYYKLYL